MFGADCDPIARQTVGTGYGHRFHVRGSGLMLNAMGAWSNRRDVQILSSAQNLSGRLAPTAPRARFLYAPRPGGFESLLLRRICLLGTQNKKAPILGSFLNQNGGGGGIRTLVTLYRPNGFRDRRIQPLCHPSAWGKNKAGSKACFGINWRRVRDLNPGDAFDAYTISNRAPSATRTTLR